jgi:hypothetical protein
MPDKGEGRAPLQCPALHTGAHPSDSPRRIPDRPDTIGAERVALARGEVPCACCTREKRRRDALDRLHAQDQLARIAAAFLRLNRPDPGPACYCWDDDL